MAERSKVEQSEHDKVVTASVQTYWQQGKTAYSNPNGEKNYEVEGQYPDVVVPANGVIEEIETESSINRGELENQWLPYSELEDWNFILVVPKTKVDEAKTLVSGLDIHKLQYYEISGNQIMFYDGLTGGLIAQTSA